MLRPHSRAAAALSDHAEARKRALRSEPRERPFSRIPSTRRSQSSGPIFLRNTRRERGGTVNGATRTRFPNSRAKRARKRSFRPAAHGFTQKPPPRSPIPATRRCQNYSPNATGTRARKKRTKKAQAALLTRGNKIMHEFPKIHREKKTKRHTHRTTHLRLLPLALPGAAPGAPPPPRAKRSSPGSRAAAAASSKKH